jgi:predicted anti-sigma-YlaC factor YlaD
MALANIRLRLSATLALVLSTTGCLTHIAEEGVANALSSQGDSFQSDEDPELVQGAIPFGLKVMESLLGDLPNHRGLLLSACSGFAGYGYAFVQQPAEQSPDLARSKAGRERARKLLRRARDYCFRNLDVDHPHLAETLLSGDRALRQAALAKLGKDEVPVLYWTAVSWSLLISDSLDDLAIIGQLPAAAAVAERALALDPAWNAGALYDFFVSLDAARGVDLGGGPAKAKQDFERSQALSGGTRLGPILSYAEGVLLPAQDRKGFEAALAEVLGYDVEQPKARANRLANVLAQQRARWLKSRLDELFL